MLIRLILLPLLLLPITGKAQTAPLSWDMIVNGTALPETLTIDWLIKNINDVPRKKAAKQHDDHQHYEYIWKKAGIRIKANHPGGFVNSIDVSFKKSKVRARAKSSATPMLSLSVAGELLDEQTPVSSLLIGQWNHNAGNGNNLIPTQYFVTGQGTRINAYLNSSRTELNRVLITFSR